MCRRVNAFCPVDAAFRWKTHLRQFCIIAFSSHHSSAALQTTELPGRRAEEKQKRIEFLGKKVRTKDEILAELMAEHIALRISLGNSDRDLDSARSAGSWSISSDAGRRRPRSESAAS